MAVNTAFFGDPCGYEEFLRVVYRCIPASLVRDDCNGGSRAAAGGTAAGGTAASRDSAAGHHGYHAALHAATKGGGMDVDARSRPPTPALYDHGYVASPNYPGKYYLDTECRWKLVAQRQQSLRITLYDFELDVKRAGRCHEFLEISAVVGVTETSGATGSTGGAGSSWPAAASGLDTPGGSGGASPVGRVYFRDCGSLGKQTMMVDANEAIVRFKTGQASLAQRGFILYFEAVGPGCSDLAAPPNGRVRYHVSDDGTLYANVTCDAGFGIDDGSSPDSSASPPDRVPAAAAAEQSPAGRQVRCLGTVWDLPDQQQDHHKSIRCSVVTPNAVDGRRNVITTRFKPATTVHNINRTASLVGMALTVASAILLVALLLTVALYFHKRRQKLMAERRLIVNNMRRDVNGGGASGSHHNGNNGGGGVSNGFLKRNSGCSGGGSRRSTHQFQFPPPRSFLRQMSPQPPPPETVWQRAGTDATATSFGAGAGIRGGMASSSDDWAGYSVSLLARRSPELRRFNSYKTLPRAAEAGSAAGIEPRWCGGGTVGVDGCSSTLQRCSYDNDNNNGSGNTYWNGPIIDVCPAGTASSTSAGTATLGTFRTATAVCGCRLKYPAGRGPVGTCVVLPPASTASRRDTDDFEILALQPTVSADFSDAENNVIENEEDMKAELDMVDFLGGRGNVSFRQQQTLQNLLAGGASTSSVPDLTLSSTAAVASRRTDGNPVGRGPDGMERLSLMGNGNSGGRWAAIQNDKDDCGSVAATSTDLLVQMDFVAEPFRDDRPQNRDCIDGFAGEKEASQHPGL